MAHDNQSPRGGQDARRHVTKGLAINWREVGSFGFLFAIQLRLRREVINLAFAKSINFKLNHLASATGGKIFKYQFIAKPSTLWATRFETP